MPKPVRGAYIVNPMVVSDPPTIRLEDEIVQAVPEVLSAIFESNSWIVPMDFGWPTPHQALRALYIALMTPYVNWALDIHIRGFFES